MIKNLNDSLSPLNALLKGAREAVNKAELNVANRIAEQARSVAPGSLGSKISVIQTGEETIIDAGDELSAYVEFGTGTATVEATILAVAGPSQDTDIIDEAYKFFVTGKGHGKSHPYFFPAIYEHREELLPEIEKELENLTK